MACGKDLVQPDVQVPGTKNGQVTGMITDTKNLPIKDARITIEHTVWYNSYLFAASNNEGKYKLSLPNELAGDWIAKAQLSKTTYSQIYKFYLEPDNTGVFSKTLGAVRNFRWKLSGQLPGGNGYYGAHVDLYLQNTGSCLTNRNYYNTPRISMILTKAKLYNNSSDACENTKLKI